MVMHAYLCRNECWLVSKPNHYTCRHPHMRTTTILLRHEIFSPHPNFSCSYTVNFSAYHKFLCLKNLHWQYATIAVVVVVVYLQSREMRTNKCGTLWCFSTASSALEQNNHAAESMSDGLASQVNIYKLFLLWLWWKMIAGTINIFSFIFFGIWVCSD